MTYEEIKDKLGKCERSLSALQNGNYANLQQSQVPAAINQLQVMKEELENELVVLEQSKTAFVNQTAVSYEDESELHDLKRNQDVESIKTAKGKKIKENLKENIQLSMEETKAIAKKAGEATLKALKNMGEGISSSKAKRIVPGKFEIYVEFKNGKNSLYEFTIDREDKLYLSNEDFDKMVGQVGVQPSGEAILHVDVVAGNIERAIKANLRENEDYDPDQEQKDDEEDHGVGYDDEGRPLGEDKEQEDWNSEFGDDAESQERIDNEDYPGKIKEGEGDDHHYIKVKAHDYKKAMAILDQNVDPTYVKMEVVDNDGAGNVIIYFIFKHEDGFDDMYDDSENPDSEFYQEPDEDPQAFVYDVVMDLRANDIELADHSADMDEATDLNDPVLMKMRVAKKRNADFKKLDAYSKSPEGKAAVRAQASGERKEQKAREIVRKLKIKRAQVEREMENNPGTEPQGGPVSDMYGKQLNKIDNAIEKAASVYNKPMDYDTAVGKVNEGDGELVTFGYDLDSIQDVVDHLQNKYKEGEDFELHVGRGDTHPNAVTLKNPALEKDYDLNDMLNAAQDDQDRYDAYTDGEDTDYAKRRKEGDDYYEDPDYYKEGAAHPEGNQDGDDEELSPEELANKHAGSPMREDEDLDVGHQDDEPSMLKSSAMETAEYAAKLYKKLAKYDQHDGEVDFPNWWQKKLILAREYMSAAYHYLDSNEKQPAMDQLALEGKEINEDSLNKLQKGYDSIVKHMKELAKLYKAGDKSVVPTLKDLSARKKQLEVLIDKKVSGTGRDQELDINEYGGSASRNLDEIFGALGYRQGFDEFIEDNPGCVEVIMEWIGSIRDFQQTLSQEYDNEELENLGFYFGDDDEYNESLHEGRGDLDIIVRVITDMANEDGTTTKEAALEVIEAIRDAYMIDAYDEGVNESLNPEVSKKVSQFIKAMAKRYGYEEQDAVYAIIAALKQREFDGVNEDVSMKIGKVVAIKKYNAVKNQKVSVDVKITDYIKKPGSKDFVEYELKGKKRKVSIDVFKSILAENNKILKEFTDNSFKGSEVIDDANKRGPDMFGKGIFAELLPKGVASENDAVEALKAHDKSGIKARMKQYAPMFVHVQYHEVEHEDNYYRMHQTQYYNSNFKDKDPDFNPGVSKITLFKILEKATSHRERDTTEDLGTIIVKTDQYVQDLRNIPGLGKRVSESVNEAEDYKYKKYVAKAFEKISGEMFAFRNAMGVKQLGQADPKLQKRLDAMQTEISSLRKEMKSQGLAEATRQDLGMSSSVSKRRAKAELNKPGNDGSKVYGLDKDGKRVHIKSINDVDKFKKFELDADINEGKGGQIMPGDYVKNQHGNIYQRVDGKVGRHDAYVRVTNGKAGKKKTGLHDSFKLTLVKKEDIKEDKATYCGGCGTTHKKSSGCPKK